MTFRLHEANGDGLPLLKPADFLQNFHPTTQMGNAEVEWDLTSLSLLVKKCPYRPCWVARNSQYRIELDAGRYDAFQALKWIHNPVGPPPWSVTIL